MLKITIILLSALALRLYGINWDQGVHLHPDERMLMIVAERLHFFDRLNPEFFNYGSLPLYVLRGVTQIIDALFGADLGNYAGMLYVGRFLSATVDVATAFLVYLIAHFLFREKRIALLASFFYAIAFFPIQNGHFFIVDTWLTFFTTALIYTLLLYLKKPSWKKVIWIAISSAAAVTTKFTAIIFLPVVLVVLFYRNFRQKNNSFLKHALLFIPLFLLFAYLFMPYAFLSWQKFLGDVLLQIKLNSDAYIFPYTLQYVGTLPYLYYLKNIFLWGLGPFISLLAATGLYFFFKEKKKEKLVVFLLLFNLFYFLVLGRSAVKFMRYMLPLYPSFALLAGYGAYRLSHHKKSKNAVVLLMALSVLYSLMFVNIYTSLHPRIVASNWINRNIPPGATLAVEHWDDSLPLSGGEKYNFVEMTLYELPDDEAKWEVLNQKLDSADYIILSSNRLYVPLQKLAECGKYKVCYPKTSKYYQRLFAEESGWRKKIEFSVYPSLQLGDWRLHIPDDGADESFTVYDHPKVIIFEKEKSTKTF